MNSYYHNDILMAIHITSVDEGVHAVTPENEPLQVLTMTKMKGESVKAHRHEPKARQTTNLQECLVVKKGILKIDLYFENECFKSVILNTGDAFITMRGGHAIYFLEDSEILEIKNGPYIEDKILI